MQTTDQNFELSNMRKALRNKGVTYRKVALMVGVTENYIAKIMTGLRPVTPEIAEAIDFILSYEELTQDAWKRWRMQQQDFEQNKVA